MDGTFTVIGGANVGGSCYLLETAGVRILFDCGIRLGASYREHPEIPDPENIDAIFVSHAHLDHMGALAYVAAFCPKANIYMTRQTKEFIQYQLEATIGEYIGAETEDLRYNNALLCRLIMNRTQEIEYEKKYRFLDPDENLCEFSFFRAGHVPGAAMVYLKIRDRKILYTGDFSPSATAMTSPFSLPMEKLQVDTLILCGTHANRNDYDKGNNYYALQDVSEWVRQKLRSNEQIIFRLSQLTKGLEMISLLDEMVEYGQIPKPNVRIDRNLWALASRYERTSETFRLPPYMQPLNDDGAWNGPTVILATPTTKLSKFPHIPKLTCEFSLHGDYSDIIDFISRLSPRKAFLVHVSKRIGSERPVEEAFLSNPNISIVYTENGGRYNI